MTNEFTDLELQTEVTDMEPDEAKKTLSEFMEAHQKNRSAYDELSSELDDVETEYQEKLEEREEKLAEFKQERAEKAAEFAQIPEELIVERFSFSEIEQIIEEGEEADFSAEEEEAEEEEPDNILDFSEKPEKGRAKTDDTPSEKAHDLVHQHW